MPGTLAAMLALAVLLLLGTGTAFWLAQSRAGAPAPVAALYDLALDAPAAAAGEAPALARFEHGKKALEQAAARDAGAPYASDARFTRLMTNAAAVLRARATLGDAASAAAAQSAASAIAADARALAQAAASGTAP